MILEKISGIDARQKNVRLSIKAKKISSELESLWEDFGQAVIEIEKDSNMQFLNGLSEFEISFKKNGIYKRVMETHKNKQMKEVNIIHFEEKYAEDFANLNYEWLNENFEIEKHDREMLDDPQKYIIENQGQVLLAEINNIIVGTVALLYIDENTYELAKMAVTQGYKGQQIGKKLMLEAIEYAKKVGKKGLILESNTKLVPAINLYRKVGFKAIELDPETPYERCDIRMKLIL